MMMMMMILQQWWWWWSCNDDDDDDDDDDDGNEAFVVLFISWKGCKINTCISSACTRPTSIFQWRSYITSKIYYQIIYNIKVFTIKIKIYYQTVTQFCMHPLSLYLTVKIISNQQNVSLNYNIKVYKYSPHIILSLLFSLALVIWWC